MLIVTRVKKAHTFQRTIGANTVEDQVVILGEPYLPGYVVGFNGISVGTSSDHVFQIMAGSSDKVRIRRIWLLQNALASSAGRVEFTIWRLSTAGTGGSVITPRPLETTDAAAGATAMTLPSSKGTESTFLQRFTLPMYAAFPVANDPWEWVQLPNQKPITIAAGTSNGIALKVLTGITSATVSGYIEFDETSF
jgi:hypothetical protein